MDKTEVLKKLERIEINARNVLDDIAALREELSGGSDSSNSQVFTRSQKNQIVTMMRKRMKA